MLKKIYGSKITIILHFFIIFLLIQDINSQQIIYPLKLIKSNYTKYPLAKNIFIKITSLKTINFNSFQKIQNFGQNSKEFLTSSIDILSSNLFATEIHIGSNNQKLNVILDTGSQILWVPENNSFTSNTEINFYEPKESKTAQYLNKEFEIYYGTGYCRGYMYKDLIDFLYKDKYYIFLGSANYSIFDVEGADGILGLAKSYPNYLLSPIFTLKNNGVIQSASFSFKFDSMNNNLFMYVGQPHKDFNSKNVAFCNLLSNTNYEKMLWACKLNNFGFIKNKSIINSDENLFVKANISVIFDTGTNMILLPYDLIIAMKDKIKKYNCIIGSSSAYFSEQSFSFIVCFDIDKIPDISLQFDNYILILNKYKMFFEIDFNYGIKGYFLNIQFQKQLGIAIIGQNFFTEFHTLFDPENNVLKFYNQDKERIVNINTNRNNDSTNNGIIFFIIILIILILVVLYYRNRQKQNIENNYEWMGQNYSNNFKFNNINNYT